MEKLLPWATLKTVPGIGNLRFKRLLSRFKSPEQVLQAPIEALLEVQGISSRLARAISRHRLPDWARKDLDLAERKGYAIITMDQPEYPFLLLQIPDPPPFLYVYGHLTSSMQTVAVVGSRNATPYGLSATEKLCRDLIAHNIIVVSGMAKGIDTAAHQGALLGGGETIAVLGSGLERIYPASNFRLFHQIAQSGAVISEFPLCEMPQAQNFPIRNRIISGLSLGTVVVEAAKKSGSLITARLSAEQNREVFAVPGSIRSFKSTGAHNLIKQGAKLVESAEDIVEELSPVIDLRAYSPQKLPAVSSKLDPLSPSEATILDALSPYPIHIDHLARKLAMDVGRLSGILLQLELKGFICQTPGKLFSTGSNTHKERN
jgi:DNA processing protein